MILIIYIIYIYIYTIICIHYVHMIKHLYVSACVRACVRAYVCCSLLLQVAPSRSKLETPSVRKASWTSWTCKTEIEAEHSEPTDDNKESTLLSLGMNVTQPRTGVHEVGNAQGQGNLRRGNIWCKSGFYRDKSGISESDWHPAGICQAMSS